MMFCLIESKFVLDVIDIVFSSSFSSFISRSRFHLLLSLAFVSFSGIRTLTTYMNIPIV